LSFKVYLSPQEGKLNRRKITSQSVRVSAQRACELLEARRLLAAGDFDPTFGGGDGGVFVDFAATGTNADFGQAMAVQGDGKIVIAGTTGGGGNTDDRIGLARLNTDGTLDTSFDGDGRVAFPVLAPSDVEVNAVTISPVDGKIVVVGAVRAPYTATADWLVARFNSDGSIDNTFSGDGIATVDGGSNFSDTLYGVAIQPDGKIVATGVATQATSNLALLRFNTDGSLDNTFNGNGRQIVDFFGGVDFAADVMIDPDGKIVMVGGSVVPGSYRRFVILRFNSNGTPDNTFDGDGRASTDFGQTAFGKSVLRQPDGKYVVAGLDGSDAASNTQYYAAARYNANGSLDTTFGNNPSLPGTTTITSIHDNTFAMQRIARQSDGAILIAGTHYEGSPTFNSYAAVVRLNSNGAPDTSWDGDGVRLYTVPGTAVGDTNGNDIAFTSDGKIVVTGYTFGFTVDFVAMRLQTGLDLVAPTVTDGRFNYDTRQEVQISFSEDVAASVGLSDLQLVRLGPPDTSVAPQFLNVSGGTGINTVARWVYGTAASGLLPDGNYRATLPAGNIEDAAHNTLADPYTLDFFVLSGDANHDRKVDTLDFNALAANFGKTGTTYSQADFNYDGKVDTLDFNTLAAQFGKTLAPPAMIPATPSAPSPAQASSPFSSHVIANGSGRGLPTDLAEAEADL
jgi:uncharacterized delta-60 repeat protein